MADTVGDLASLELEERAISQRRRRLHERIEFVKGSGVQDATSLERLAALEAEEKEISRCRRELHRRIDALREQAAASTPPGREPKEQPKESLLEKPNRAYVAAMHLGSGSLTRDDPEHT